MKVSWGKLAFWSGLFGIIITFILIVVSIAFAETSIRPKKGEWVCWANVKGDETSRVIGWHKQKKVALQTALDKCEDYFGEKCEMNYCEKLK